MKAIAAMDANRVIGYKGKIPWHLPDDFKWFKHATLNRSLIMGRTTFESVGELPHRHTFVLSNQKHMGGKNHDYVTYDELVEECSLYDQFLHINTWVCGGAKVYQLLLPLCSEVYMTHVMGEYEGDTFMPPFEDMFPNQTIVMEHKDFWVVKYTR